MEPVFIFLWKYLNVSSISSLHTYNVKSPSAAPQKASRG